MTTRDEQLNGDGAKLEETSRGMALKYFGIPDERLLGLCAAPQGSTVTTEWVETWEGRLEDDEEVPLGLLVEVKSKFIAKDSSNQFVLYKDPAGGTSLYWKLIDFAEAGFGGPLTWRIANEARAASLTRLRLLGAGGRLWEPRDGGRPWTGYTSWPKYGFDMFLADNYEKADNWGIIRQFPYLPAGLSRCDSVQDVLELRDGPAFWKLCGDGSYMEFDLRPDSRSWDCLNKWKQEGDQMKTTAKSSRDWGGQQSKFANTTGLPVPAAAGTPARKRLELRPMDSANTVESLRSVRANRDRKGAEVLED